MKELWLTRSESGALLLWSKKPHCINNCYWAIEDSEEDWGNVMALSSYLYPNVTFENSPQRVEIKTLYL